ncbi:MAG: T9SS type A sorting domain-containing protein, partial [Bacteroidales bacterium]
SVEMGPNGEVYAGTGESFANVLGNNFSTPGIVGKGIYKSDDGDNFSLLSSTVPAATNSANVPWALVNRIAVDQNNGNVWVATNNGLKLSTDGGDSWDDPPLLPGGGALTINCPDVKVSPGGVVVAVIGNSVYISKTGQINDFTKVSTGSSNMLPSSNIRRVEVAVADNDQTIYAVIAADDGSLKNIYMSDDTGDSWSVVGPGGSSSFGVFGDNNQGGYDNVVAVDPSDPYHVFVGGINMWEGIKVTSGQPYSWQKITQGSLDQIGSPISQHHVHVDHHVYKFHPNNDKIMYAGTDGGIFRTKDKGNSFSPLNRNFNVTQFYAVALGPHGEVMGGTQDNSTPYVSGKGNTAMNAEVLFFGDGGHSAFSVLNQDVFFVTSQYGVSGRSNTKGDSWELGIERDASGDEIPGYYDERLMDDNHEASFVTPILLWESANVDNSQDSIAFRDTATSYSAGDTVIMRSHINQYPFEYVFNQNLNAGDEIQVADPVQSRYFLGTTDAVWMTREALDFSVTPEWFKIADINGIVQSMEISEDGDVMYVGTQGGGTGKIYRISNIMAAWDSSAAYVNSSQQVIQSEMIKEFQTGRWVTSIALDPTDKDHIIVTLGNYGESTYIYRSTDATSANPTFESRQGNLPEMPVYASLIPMWHSNSVMIGTEYGVYATDDISVSSPDWAEENNGMDRVPVYMFDQQTQNLPYRSITKTIEGETFTDIYPGITNYGEIVIGTYGRGFFSTKKYVGMQKPPERYVDVEKMDIKIYPNPVMDHATVEIELNKPAEVSFRIFDISGRVISSRKEDLSAGKQDVKFELDKLKPGNYILQLIYDGDKSEAKQFIKL